mmetsp:Transcript_1023/g.2564  ORF Transcript_1023/g.2564 Transcript_1023/m.2564 type:complete len:147 (-) Transcript_1023:1093-1533(-)
MLALHSSLEAVNREMPTRAGPIEEIDLRGAVEANGRSNGQSNVQSIARNKPSVAASPDWTPVLRVVLRLAERLAERLAAKPAAKSAGSSAPIEPTELSVPLGLRSGIVVRKPRIVLEVPGPTWRRSQLLPLQRTQGLPTVRRRFAL